MAEERGGGMSRRIGGDAVYVGPGGLEGSDEPKGPRLPAPLSAWAHTSPRALALRHPCHANSNRITSAASPSPSGASDDARPRWASWAAGLAPPPPRPPPPRPAASPSSGAPGTPRPVPRPSPVALVHGRGVCPRCSPRRPLQPRRGASAAGLGEESAIGRRGLNFGRAYHRISSPGPPSVPSPQADHLGHLPCRWRGWRRPSPVVRLPSASWPPFQLSARPVVFISSWRQTAPPSLVLCPSHPRPRARPQPFP